MSGMIGAQANADSAEARAIQAVLSGRRRARLTLALRAMRKILANPEDTEQVFILFMALHAPLIPGFIARFMREPGAAELMAERPAIDSQAVDLEALRRLPEGTLGRAFVAHLDRYGLSPDIFQAPPGVPQDIGYVAQRLRQSHDLWHVLTGYDTSVPDELALQAFTFTQTRMPGPALLAVAGAVRFWRERRDIFGHVAEGYRRGRATRSLLTARWEAMWETPLEDVRRQFGIPPARASMARA